MDASEHFRKKRITVMGLGLLGGVGDIKFLAECGADIIATDLKGEAELAPSLAILKGFPNIKYTLGRHELEDFRERDLIIKAPSTPLDSPFIAEAKKNGIPITMWAALFAKLSGAEGATIIGITGTRGKTTVTAMISAILRAAGKNVIEGGNVQGTSLLPKLSSVDSDVIAVLELDSWKLQGFAEARYSPSIAVFTTFYPDHLNYYGSAALTTGQDPMDAYLADKANIFLFQTENDLLILGSQAAPIVTDVYGNQIRSEILAVGEGFMPEDWVLKIPGDHNRYNAALSIALARESGIEDEIIRKVLESFTAVPGRLEFICEKNGVKIYNDTTATTPDATLAALEALGAANTVLIAGGTDKELPLDGLVPKLKEVKKLILLRGTGTDRLKSMFLETSIHDSLEEAVADAFAHASAGDNILLSPAFTSFGMFKNEYDRGDQFNMLIKKI